MTVDPLRPDDFDRPGRVGRIPAPPAAHSFDQAQPTSAETAHEEVASRRPFQRSVEALRAEGVRVLLGPGGVEPHPPRTGGELIDSYPWHLALEEAEHILSTAGPIHGTRRALTE